MTLEIAPELEARLEEKASARGLTKEEFAVHALRRLTLTEEELEELEDEEDAAEADHILATTDPSQWRTLDELRAAIRRRQNAP